MLNAYNWKTHSMVCLPTAMHASSSSSRWCDERTTKERMVNVKDGPRGKTSFVYRRQSRNIPQKYHQIYPSERLNNDFKYVRKLDFPSKRLNNDFEYVCKFILFGFSNF
jgi:hypothetical protein